jgi:hypothetical protein
MIFGVKTARVPDPITGMACRDESSSHIDRSFLDEALGNRPSTVVQASVIVANGAFAQWSAFHILAHHHVG